MKKQILVIHGGNAFDEYDEYLSYLKGKEVSIERIQSKDWKANLQTALGDEYQVLTPQMPNSQNARYVEWKIYFDRLITILQDEVILIGHSLGGIFLAKYLSENTYSKKIRATFLVAAPFNTRDQHPLVDFNIENNLKELERQGGEVFLYHSGDDMVVPFSNLISYRELLPNAIVRTFDGKGHFNESTFPEIVEDIKNI